MRIADGGDTNHNEQNVHAMHIEIEYNETAYQRPTDIAFQFPFSILNVYYKH